MLHSRGYLSEEARLLSTYPLTIAGNDVTDEFREYPECKPPEDVQHNDNMYVERALLSGVNALPFSW